MIAASPVADTDAQLVTGEKKSSNFWQIFWTAVLTASATAGLGLIGQDKAAQWAAQREEKTKEVTEFVTHAQKFDALVGEYISKLNAGQSTTKERKALQDNLLAQYNSLDTAKTNLDEQGSHRATAYQNEIGALGDMLNQDPVVLEARPVIQAIADARSANVCVVYDLRKEVNLPTVVTDKKRCEAESIKNA